MALDSADRDASLDFPFLNDEKTIAYLGQSQTLFLLRGLPGSGKSTLAEAICEKYPGKSAVCSAQQHLPEGSRPPYDKAVLQQSHAKCEECIRKYCKEGIPIVIVDNTSLTLWEIQKYSAIGHDFNYTELLVQTKTSWHADPEMLAQKTSRGYTVEAIRNKLGKLQTPLYPLFYGWFVNKADSERMRSLGHSFFEKCLQKDTFREEFVKHLLPTPGSEPPDPQHYFSSADYIVGPLMLHCTAFFSNHGEIGQSAAYAARESVKADNGKAFDLLAIGLLITPRSLGLRLKLDSKELPLWDSEDSENGREESEQAKGLKENTKEEEDSCIITFLSPTCGTGSRAHFSLGSGPGVEPVQTGLDLVQIIKLEQEIVHTPTPPRKGETFVPVDKGMARGFGNGNWMVYFDEPCKVGLLFSAFY